MTDFAAYPKWVAVDGPGHPMMPGHVLVSNEDEEREAEATGAGPANLNPPANAGQKAIDDMDRDELVALITREGIPDYVRTSTLRNMLKRGRDDRAADAEEDAKADLEEAKSDVGGDHGDGLEHTGVDEPVKDDPEVPEDQDGEKVTAPVDAEANKPRRGRQPKAKSFPAYDARPDELKDAQIKSDPATNISDAVIKD